jgi:hypothetical protein
MVNQVVFDGLVAGLQDTIPHLISVSFDSSSELLTVIFRDVSWSGVRDFWLLSVRINKRAIRKTRAL